MSLAESPPKVNAWLELCLGPRIPIEAWRKFSASLPMTKHFGVVYHGRLVGTLSVWNSVVGLSHSYRVPLGSPIVDAETLYHFLITE